MDASLHTAMLVGGASDGSTAPLARAISSGDMRDRHASQTPIPNLRTRPFGICSMLPAHFVAGAWQIAQTPPGGRLSVGPRSVTEPERRVLRARHPYPAPPARPGRGWDARRVRCDAPRSCPTSASLLTLLSPYPDARRCGGWTQNGAAQGRSPSPRRTPIRGLEHPSGFAGCHRASHPSPRPTGCAKRAACRCCCSHARTRTCW